MVYFKFGLIWQKIENLNKIATFETGIITKNRFLFLFAEFFRFYWN